MNQVDSAGASHPIIIESLGVYLPHRAVSTADVLAGCRLSHQIPLEQATGIRSRRVAAPGEFAIDLARAAIENCLAYSRYQACEIDLLISASLSHYDAADRYHSYEPSTAMRLKALLGFERAVAFDVSNGCAGLWTAILIAEALIATGRIGRALVVSGEFITDLTRTAQREIASYLDPQIASLTVGDSGVALTLEAAGNRESGLNALEMYTVARYASYCVTRPTSQAHGGGVMVTDSLRLGARSIDHVVTHLADTLSEAGWSPRDIAHLVPHQTSKATLLSGLKRINDRLSPNSFPDERFLINLAERGNTATTTHFIAIKDAIDAGQVHRGDRAAFCITGSGLTIGTALYRFDGLPERLRGGEPQRERPRRPVEPLEAAGLDAGVSTIAAAGLVRSAEARPLDTVELCRRAATACLARAGCAPGEVELLIHAGLYRTDFLVEPALAALAAGALDLNAETPPGAARRTLAFDLTAGSLGVLKACWVADRMIRSGRYRRTLVVASDVENNAAYPEDGLFGLETAGSALLLERGEAGVRFEHFHFRDYPEHVDALESYAANPEGRPHLVVRRRPSYTTDACLCLATTVRELLTSLQLSLDSFDAILAPAGQPDVEAALIRDLGIGDRLVSLQAQGDLMGSSLACGLLALEENGLAGSGARVLALAVGAGIQTGCAVLRFT